MPQRAVVLLSLRRFPLAEPKVFATSLRSNTDNLLQFSLTDTEDKSVSMPDELVQMSQLVQTNLQLSFRPLLLAVVLVPHEQRVVPTYILRLAFRCIRRPQHL